MLRKKGLIITAASFSLLLAGCTEGGSYVAKVGEVEITEKELLTVFLEENNGGNVLNNLINRELLLKTVDVEDEEVEKRVEELKLLHNAKNVKELAQIMLVSEKEILEHSRIRAAEIKLLREKANITDEEFEAHFQEYKNRLTFNSVELTSVDEAEKVLKLVNKGETLENASHKTIEDYHLRFNWATEVSEYELPTEVFEQLANVNQGEISAPIEMDGLVYLYEVVQRRDIGKEVGYYDAYVQLAAKKGVDLTTLYKGLPKDEEIKINKKYEDKVNF